MKLHCSERNQKGLSLVELMVALAIGLLLMAGVLQIYLGSRQSYRVQESLSRLQENGRFALMFMEKDIRMAGYRGCATRSADDDSFINVLNSKTDYTWDFGTSIQGYEATSSSSWNATPDSSIVTPLGGRDILTVRRATGEIYSVVTHASSTDDVTLNGGVHFKEDDIVMLADCRSAVVFQVTSTDSAAAAGTLKHETGGSDPGNASNDLVRPFQGSDAFLLDTVSYFIRTNNDTGRPSLYRKVGSGNAQELIQDVEDMQITYGEDTNGDALVDSYVTAVSVANWNNVISVNINLLLTTPEDFLTPSGPQAYVFNGVTYDGEAGNGALPADNRLRRAFSSTITLRNRTL